MIAVTGYQGRLGLYLISKYSNCVPLECDVTNLDSVKRAIDEVQPESILHCAAVTDVDACESTLYEQALEVNIQGTRNVRSAFEGQIIYMSTDYVFDGVDGPYSEEAEPNPQNHYGYTKALGEEEILLADYPTDVIVRTTILYGGHKPDFVTSILDKLKTNEMFHVTGALLGSPTYIPHLANGLRKLFMLKQPPKIINISGNDVISRWVFACKIAKAFNYPIHNVLLTMRSQAGRAIRPRKAGLKTHLAKALKIPIYSVDDGLKEYKIVKEKNEI
jgi:dTDP-4-dehydrorhamnose reductase